jgi:hypothetical protein
MFRSVGRRKRWERLRRERLAGCVRKGRAGISDPGPAPASGNGAATSRLVGPASGRGDLLKEREATNRRGGFKLFVASPNPHRTGGHFRLMVKGNVSQKWGANPDACAWIDLAEKRHVPSLFRGGLSRCAALCQCVPVCVCVCAARAAGRNPNTTPRDARRPPCRWPKRGC